MWSLLYCHHCQEPCRHCVPGVLWARLESQQIWWLIEIWSAANTLGDRQINRPDKRSATVFNHCWSDIRENKNIISHFIDIFSTAFCIGSGITNNVRKARYILTPKITLKPTLSSFGLWNYMISDRIKCPPSMQCITIPVCHLHLCAVAKPCCSQDSSHLFGESLWFRPADLWN